MNDLAAIYATIPPIDCKGLCARSCGPVIAEIAEAKAAGASYDVLDLTGELRTVTPKTAMAEIMLTAFAGRRLAAFRFDRKLRCNLLHLGRCTAHANRPAVCRLWGVVDSMPCLWGCVPERMLTHEEGQAILAAVREACAP